MKPKFRLFNYPMLIAMIVPFLLIAALHLLTGTEYNLLVAFSCLVLLLIFNSVFAYFEYRKALENYHEKEAEAQTDEG